MQIISWPSHFLYVGVWYFLHGALYYYVVETEKSNRSFSLSWVKKESNKLFLDALAHPGLSLI